MLGLSYLDLLVILLSLGLITVIGVRALRGVKRYGWVAGGLYVFIALLYCAVEIGMIFAGTGTTVEALTRNDTTQVLTKGPPPRLIVRFEDPAGGRHHGLLEDGKVIEVSGGVGEFMEGRYNRTGRIFDRSTIRLLPPVEPSKIVGFGWTYSAHAREVGGEEGRKDPLVFLKPPTVLIGHGDTIRYPRTLTSRVEYEGELAVIIGRTVKDLSPEQTQECILGYTCFNDVTARDLTSTDPEYTRGKGFDTFGPLGPWIVVGMDGSDRVLTTRLNGKVQQQARTSEMIYTIPFLISYISKVMTLNPGDVVATGTPGGSGRMIPGDVVEVEIEGIGTLRNPVR